MSGADGTAVADELMSVARGYLGEEDLHGAWFELGGSSMAAVRLIGELGQRFGRTVTLTDLLLADSVHEFLTELAGAPPRS